MYKTSWEFLDQYLSGLSPEERRSCRNFNEECLGIDEYDTARSTEQVLTGEKTASCSLAWWYTHKGEPMPVVGDLRVITDWEGSPLAVTRTSSVSECAFADVSENFFRACGSGLQTLSEWQNAYWRLFSVECRLLGIRPSRSMNLILERFELVYPVKGSTGPDESCYTDNTVTALFCR